MSQAVPASFQVKYQNNMELALNQQRSILEGCCTVTDDASAEIVKVMDIIGNSAPQEADERHGDTKVNDTGHTGAWVGKLNELYDADYVDFSDKLSTQLDLDGGYTMKQAGTIARAKDRRILEGFYSPIISGKPGQLVSTAFPAGLIIPVTAGGAAGAQRLNLAKVRLAKLQLDQQFVDAAEDRFMVVNAIQADDLLAEVQTTSRDFEKAYAVKYNEKGGLAGLLGFNFVQIELGNPLLGPNLNVPGGALSTLDATSYRRTPFWSTSGLRLNYWNRLRTMVDRLPQKLGTVQIFSGMTAAATRVQAGKCGIILNSEV